MIKKQIMSKYQIWEEINNQEYVIISSAKKILESKKYLLDIFNYYKNIFFIGCGSSYHIGLTVNHIFKEFLSYNSICIPSSDFILYPNLFLKKKSLYVLISRTGMTTETFIAAQILKKNNKKTISITTSSNSDMSRESSFSIALTEANEQSITATKSTSATLASLITLILMIANRYDLINDITVINDKYSKNFSLITDFIKKIINQKDYNKFIFLGSGPTYGIAKEADLKVKEMSLSDTYSCRTLEFRHGHKAIVNKKTLSVLFLSCNSLDYEIRTIKDLYEIGSTVLLIIDNENTLKKIDKIYKYAINLNLEEENILKPIFLLPIGQLIGYYQAIKKGIDPTNPKNLSYSVTF